MLVRVVSGSDTTGLTLALVNGVAGPLGGDRLQFRLDVGPGANVTVCSVAASIAQPGPHAEQSNLAVDITVGDGATLDWRPEPSISVVGSDHRVDVRLWATGTSKVAMREGVSLGRTGEPCGRFALHERVVIDGVAVLDHETAFAPGPLLGAGAHGPWRSMTSEVVLGVDLPAACVVVTEQCLRSTVHLASGCALVTTRR